MKVPPSLEQTGGLDEPGRLEAFIRSLSRIYGQVSRAINGQLSFGDGVSSENLDGRWVTAVSPVTPNTDFAVTHNLGRVPVGYIVMKKSAACDVYTGSVAGTTSALTLRATVASVTLVLFVV